MTHWVIGAAIASWVVLLLTFYVLVSFDLLSWSVLEESK